MSARTWVRKLFARTPVAPVARPRRRPHLGVEHLEDRAVPATFTVTNLLDDVNATGSLRWAVAQANATPGADTITFALPAGSTRTIVLGSQLTLTDAARTTIDGGNAGVTISGGNATRLLLVNSGADAALTRLTLTRGLATDGDGGAVLNAGTLRVSASTLTGNNARGGNGGGVASTGFLTVVNSTIAHNSASDSKSSPGGSGGGIWNGGQVVLNGVTISGNAGTYAVNLASNGPTEAVNTIITREPGGPSYVGPQIASSELIGVNPVGVLVTDDNGKPLLADNGGPTQTVALAAGSPAIGAGVAVSGLTTDQRGLARNAAPDIGAFETQVPTVTVVAAGGVYGGPPAGATGVTVTGPYGALPASAGAVTYTYTNTATGATQAARPTAAGSYTVVATFTPTAAGYRVGVSPPTAFEIARATPEVAVTSGDATYTAAAYAAAATVTGVSGTPAATLEGVGLTYTYYAGTTATGTPIAAPANAGTYTVRAAFPGSDNYTPAAGTKTFVISPATLTVTADADPATAAQDAFTKVYGDADPALSYAVAGLAGSDTAAAVLAGSPARTGAAGVGTYAVTVGSLAIPGGNYTLDFRGTTFSVTPRHLTGVFTVPSRAYDGTTGAEVLTRSLSNAVSGDPVSLAGGTAAFADPNAGTGKIVTLTGATLTGTAAGNYVLDGVAAAAADITRARLTVRADDKQKVFGQAVPARTYTITGFVGGETLATSGVTGAPALSTTATAASPAGTYPIAVGIGTLAAGNYDFPNLIAGTLTVDKAATAVGLSLGAASPLRGTDGLTLTAVVSVVAPGAGTPTGTVAFKAGPVTLGTAAVGANGAATLTLSAGQLAGLLAAGSYQVTASYGGDGTFDPAAGPAAALAVVAPAAVQGVVYVDFNNDGEVDFGERGIATVKVTLTGTDDLGQAVTLVTYTDAAGVYSFTGLRPSPAGYRITESQPSGWVDGRDSLGTIGGVYVGAAGNDVLSGVVLAAGQRAENYNFGERPAATGLNVSGQAAGIGFWQNKNGQKLLYALNGGGTAGTATQLGNWLAATFPNMYAGLAGKTNAQVADFYKQVFALNGNTAPAGAPKTDAQVLATALAVYVTNQSLAGTTAASYGFRVTTYGLGAAGLTLGGNGVAFGRSGTVSVTVMDLLLAVNDNSRKGVLFDTNGDGRIDFLEGVYRTIANDVFGAINELGGI